MYKSPRIIQVYGSHSRPVKVNRGLLAGCRFVVHFLTAIIIGILEDSEVDSRDYVDDIVLHNSSSSREEEAINMQKAIDEVAGALDGIDQVVNKKKEQLFMASADLIEVWSKIEPDCDGKVSKAVKDLGVCVKAVGIASINRDSRIKDAATVIKRIGGLPYAVGDKVTIIKIAGPCRSLYGSHADPIGVRGFRAIRSDVRTALWPGKTAIALATSPLVADRGVLEPYVCAVKRALSNWKRQVTHGLPEKVKAAWADDVNVRVKVKGPVDTLQKGRQGPWLDY